MEILILSILLAVSSYNIDYVSSGWLIWLLLYIIGGFIYIILIKEIDKFLNIKKNIFTKINNFLFHISFVVGLLIIVYWINWASLWEWKILHYDFIQYLILIVFAFPISLWFRIFTVMGYFKSLKNKNILSFIYLILPTSFWDFKKNLPINIDTENISKIIKAKLTIAVIFILSVSLYIAYFILSLFILSWDRNNHVNYEIQSDGKGNIKYINNLK